MSGGRLKRPAFRILAGMDIKQIPTDQLRAMLLDTERAAGATSVSTRILRRELKRRERPKRQQNTIDARRSKKEGGHE
jgi:hypothetical protein